MQPFSVYIHIPFCFHKCPYCDFNTYAVTSIPEKEYTQALLAELDYRSSLPEWRGRKVQTIFFGGGTPSLFSAAAIKKIISGVGLTFEFSEDIEISLEANPGTVDGDSLTGYREASVNRLSFGAQSFNQETLKILGRLHTSEAIEAAVSNARYAGFTNISIDLMFGAPGQTLMDVSDDLGRTIALDPTHVSTYGLTIEKGTPYFVAYNKGSISLPPEAEIIHMMNETESFLGSRGFGRYEISNFAQEGKEARHNLAYWNRDDYLGLGAGAHSFCASSIDPTSGGSRWANYALPASYMRAAFDFGKADSWSEQLSLEESVFEHFFLGLRKITGIDVAGFKNKFGITPAALYPRQLEILTERGFLSSTPTHLALSPAGLMLADSVIENFSELEVPLPYRGINLPHAVGM